MTPVRFRYLSIALSVLITFCGYQTAQAVTIFNSGGKDGRFIRVQNNGSANRLLHISEVEVYNGGVTPNGLGGSGLSTNDLAASFETEGATASFSVTHGASAALTDSAQQTGAAVYTRGGVGTFTVVDLGSTQDVGTIRNWQRFDGCCQERLSNFTVSLLADNGGLPGAVIASQPFDGQVATNSFGTTAFRTKTINPGGVGVVGTDTELGTDGRFIKVTTADTTPNNGNSFHIGEIRAFDTTATNVALATAGSTAATLDGQAGHGADSALINGALDTGATTWSRNGTPFGGLAPAGAIVDLNQVRELTSITIHQRNDGCCQDRLQNFTVTVESENGVQLFSQFQAAAVPTNSFSTFALPDMVTLEYGDQLVIDINGQAGVADLLKIGASGGGVLNILAGAELVLNFLTPANGGSTFDVLDFGTVNGTFSNITILGQVPSTVDLSRLLVNGQIGIVPEPTTGLLSLAGLAMLAGRVRRSRA